MIDMIRVRVYVMEAEKQLQPILSYLHDNIKVRGVTVFRGITGFGKSGQMHSSTKLCRKCSRHKPFRSAVGSGFGGR